MLKRIPSVLSPQLLKVLCEMGHGDTIVFADSNFPSARLGRGKPVLRYDGLDIPTLLEAVLTLFPLDTYVAQPVTLMQSETRDEAVETIQAAYAGIVEKTEGLGPSAIGRRERFAFYQEALNAYAIIATGEKTPYANIILQKGVVPAAR